MKSARYFGRVGGLAAALGIGAWLASVPWTAGADTGSSGLDIDVSYNGTDLFHMGDATATSGAGTGSLAIAFGAGSVANAGAAGDATLIPPGTDDFAFADGAGSTATAATGNFDSATATDGATAYSGLAPVTVGPGAGDLFTGGLGDMASASGVGSTADAYGVFESATASGGGTADTGFIPGVFGGGANSLNSATASGAGSTAIAAFGQHDIASVFGDHSTALAGGTGLDNLGNDDLATVFGNGLTADASGGSSLFVIEPSLFGAAADAAATAAPSDDFGLSALVTDLLKLF